MKCAKTILDVSILYVYSHFLPPTNDKKKAVKIAQEKGCLSHLLAEDDKLCCSEVIEEVELCALGADMMIPII